MLCVQYTLVGASRYLSYCYLSIILKQSGRTLVFFGRFSIKPRDGCVWKSQQISSFCNTQTSHQHPCHIQSQLNHISSSLWCSVWTSAGLLTISAWLNAVSHRHVIDQAVLFAGLQIFMLTVVSELAFLTSFYRKRKYIRGQMYTRHKSQEVLWQTLSDE